MPHLTTEELKKLKEEITPGPWDAIKTRFIGVAAEDQYISIGSITARESIAAMTATNGMDLEECPDAALIAAAPDLLSDLISLREKMEGLRVQIERKKVPQGKMSEWKRGGYNKAIHDILSLLDQ